MKSLCATGRKRSWPCVPCHEALAPHAAGADGDAGLNLLVAGAPAVLRRIEEGGDALALIILQRELPGDRRREHGDDQHA